MHKKYLTEFNIIYENNSKINKQKNPLRNMEWKGSPSFNKEHLPEKKKKSKLQLMMKD